MNIEYKKDLHHNYMVIPEAEFSKDETYGIGMLQTNRVNGILGFDRRIIDNQIYFYYDITAKQALNNLYTKSVMTYERVKSLLLSLTGTVELIYDYLLNEDDFIIMPEYIYIDLATNKAFLCYLPGYHRNIKEQIKSLLEYIMNKVDYNDKEAVLLVYNLYAVSREDVFSFDRLISVLQVKNEAELSDSKQQTDEEIEDIESSNTGSRSGNLFKADAGRQKYPEVSDLYNQKQGLFLQKNRDSQKEKSGSSREQAAAKSVPVMIEKIVGEQEILCYPVKTYLITAACILGSILVFILGIKTKIIFNSLGNQVDYSKLFALILIDISVSGYFLKKAWDKKNKLAKIITKQEYIDPRTGAKNKSAHPIDKPVPDKKNIKSEQTNIKPQQKNTWFEFKNRASKPQNKFEHNAMNKSGMDKPGIKKIATNRSEVNKTAADKIAVNRSELNKTAEDKFAVNRSEVNKTAADIFTMNTFEVKNSVVNKCTLNSTEVNKIAANKFAMNRSEVNNSVTDEFTLNKSVVNKPAANKLRDYEMNENMHYRSIGIEPVTDVPIKYSEDKCENFEEGDNNPTCLLNNVPEEHFSCQLKPDDELLYETIHIKEFPFFIGKLRKNVDYCLVKDVISRYHAKITKEQDKYFLTDLNSTNGTFLNGTALQSYQTKEINSGDEIVLANIKYKFTNREGI